MRENNLFYQCPWLTNQENNIRMSQVLQFTAQDRVLNAIAAISAGKGVLVLDNEDRENEVDLIFAAENMTEQQMAQLIRYCSGIICLCLPESYCKKINLPLMVPEELNHSQNKTAYTITIEASKGVTTGVSAHDRLTTVRAAINKDFKEGDLHFPGHVFPLQAKEGGVLVRDGHTEASVELCKLAGLTPAGVISEVTKDDGTMVRLDDAFYYAEKFGYPIVTIEDIKEYVLA